MTPARDMPTNDLNEDLQGQVEFLTGGKALLSSPSPRLAAVKRRLIWCKAKADGIVRMEEDRLSRFTWYMLSVILTTYDHWRSKSS
ncbi:hypothetical protein J27TS7_31000 [Paenibacillus dendritiformis]|nr:hypothetical protein J27TS7_31000 [Paenibacillus dendritiformis]